MYPGYPVLGPWYFVLECASRVLGTWYFVVEYYISRVPCTWYFVLTNVYPGYLITGTWNLVLCTHQSRLPSTLYLELGTWYSPVCIQGHNESCRPRFLHGLHLAKEIVVKIVTFQHCNDGNDGCRSIFVIMSYMVIFVTVGSAICQDCWLTGIWENISKIKHGIVIFSRLNQDHPIQYKKKILSRNYFMSWSCPVLWRACRNSNVLWSNLQFELHPL